MAKKCEKKLLNNPQKMTQKLKIGECEPQLKSELNSGTLER